MSGAVTWLGRLAAIFLGYLAAVIVSAAIATFLWFVFSLPGGNQSGPQTARDFIGVYQFGLFVTFATALPGFLMAVVFAFIQRWTRWLPYALAGTADSVLAILVFSAWISGSLLNLPLSLVAACLPGGFAGGVVYWAVAGRWVTSFLRPEPGAPAA